MNIDDIPAGRELDSLIAEEVCGWIWMQHSPNQESMPGGPGPRRYRFLVNPEWLMGLGDDPSWIVIPADMSRPASVSEDIPRYSTDIADAWTLIDRHPHYVYLVRSNENGRFGWKEHATWKCRFYAPPQFEAESATAQHAIAMAALRAARLKSAK